MRTRSYPGAAPLETRCLAVNCFARVLGQFKANGPTGLLLSDGSSVECKAMRCHVIDSNRNDIAAAQFTVDREIKQSEVANTVLQLKLGPD